MAIRLHKFGEAWGLADPSPFCLKLEDFLRETGVPYDTAPFDLRSSFRRAPKGKLPFIEDEDGTPLGDSSLIIAHLSQQRGIDLDAALSDRQRSVAHAFRRMLDEHLYWVGVYSRWFDEPGWSIIRAQFFAGAPAPLRGVAAALARRRMAAALRAHGLGRHQRNQIYALGEADLEALSRLLGDDPLFFGSSRPTLLDLWAHAFVAEIVIPPIDSPLKEAAKRLVNLNHHCQRIQARLYPAATADGGDGEVATRPLESAPIRHPDR